MPWSKKKPFKNTSCHIKKNYYPTFPFSQYILISYIKFIKKNGLISIPASHCVYAP